MQPRTECYDERKFTKIKLALLLHNSKIPHMANEPGLLPDDATVIKVAYQTELKNIFDIFLKNAAGAGGGVSDGDRQRFTNGYKLAQQVRDAALAIVTPGKQA